MEKVSSSYFLYYSDIHRIKFYDDITNKYLGYLCDLVLSPDDIYPLIRFVVICVKNEQLLLSIEKVDLKKILHSKKAKIHKKSLLSYNIKTDVFLMSEVLLGQKVIDLRRANIVTVKDVHIFLNHRQWIVHLDIGESRWKNMLSGHSKLRKLMPSKSVSNRKLVSIKTIYPTVRSENFGSYSLIKDQMSLEELHPGEVADLIEEFDRKTKSNIVNELSNDFAAEVITEIDEKKSIVSIIEKLSHQKTALILSEMEPNIAADILAMTDKEKQDEVLKLFEGEASETIKKIFSFSDMKVGSFVSDNFLSLRPSAKVKDALSLYRKEADEISSSYYIYLIDHNSKLVGVVTIKKLLLSAEEQHLDEIMSSRVITLKVDDTIQSLADAFLRYNFLYIPVVNDEGTMIGVVSLKHSFDDILPYLKIN